MPQVTYNYNFNNREYCNNMVINKKTYNKNLVVDIKVSIVDIVKFVSRWKVNNTIILLL